LAVSIGWLSDVYSYLYYTGGGSRKNMSWAINWLSKSNIHLWSDVNSSMLHDIIT